MSLPLVVPDPTITEFVTGSSGPGLHSVVSWLVLIVVGAVAFAVLLALALAAREDDREG